jgi:cobalt-zinc-cadmium efflux system protein
MSTTGPRFDDHQHYRRQGRRGLLLALGITGAFMLVELVGGLLTNSLALLSDAVHMLEHLFSQGMALGAFWLASRPASARRTYGYHRAEVLAALLNAITMSAVIAYISFEAVQRFQDPPEVKSGPMLLVASLGLVANAYVLMVLFRLAQVNINVRGVFIHALGDLAGSMGAVFAGILMFSFGWFLADPVISVVTAALLVPPALRLFWQTLHILLEGTPSELDLQKLADTLCGFRGVLSVHDLHAWALTSGYNALTAHVIVDKDLSRSQRDALLVEVRRAVMRQFAVHHVTLQIEPSSEEHQEEHEEHEDHSHWLHPPNGGNAP